MRPAPVDASTSYAAEVARLLWPEPWDAPYVTRTRRRTAGRPHRDAYLFPSERRPRMLVPADLPGSSTMLQRLGSGRAAWSSPIRSLLERSVRSRAFPLAGWPMLRVPATDPSADSIEHHLARCFGTEVRVGVLLGTRRVNQKPVLQIFDLTGTVLGYAKVGHNDLTAALVRREAEALSTLASLAPQSFGVPRLIHHGPWADLDVLVMSPLPTDPRLQVPAAARITAMRELMGLAGTTQAPVAQSRFWSRIRGTADLLADTPHGPHLRAAARTIEERSGDQVLTLGGWHGDWGRWNMGIGAGGLQLWDWERFDVEVPIGLDGVHFAAQDVHAGGRDERRQETAFLRSVPARLTELGVHPDQHDLTLELYLLEIAVRYADLLTHGTNAPLELRTSWVLSLLERRLRSRGPGSPEGRP